MSTPRAARWGSRSIAPSKVPCREKVPICTSYRTEPLSGRPLQPESAHRSARLSLPGEDARPRSAGQIDLGVGPLAGEARHEPRHRDEQRLARETDGVPGFRADRMDRRVSRAREHFGPPRALSKQPLDQPHLGRAVIDARKRAGSVKQAYLAQQSAPGLVLDRRPVLRVDEREGPDL